jgi:O-antigen/teichoic acid export membrane protein
MSRFEWLRRWSPASGRGQAAITAFTNLTLGGLAIITGSTAARLLGPAGRGDLAAITSFPTVIASLASFGLRESLVYYVAKEPENTGPVAVAATSLAGLLAPIPLFIAWLFVPSLLSVHSAATVMAARIYLGLFWAEWLRTPADCILRGRQRIVAWNSTRLIAPLVWLAVLCWGWLSHVNDAARLAITSVPLVVFASGLTLLMVKKDLAAGFPVDTKRWRPMLSYGFPVMLASGARQLNFRLDVVLMAAFINPRDLGLYVVAATWSGILAPLTDGVAIVLFPRVSSTNASNPAFAGLVRRSVGASLFFNVAGSVLLIVFTSFGLRLLFGRDFIPATPYAYILIVAAIPLNLSRVFASVLQGIGHTRAIMWAEATGVVITVIGLATTLRRFGPLGAAWTSVAAYSVGLAVLIVSYRLYLRGVAPAVANDA